MPHIDVLLTEAQARYLGKRAKAAQTTPSAVLQVLISRVLREAVVGGAHEAGPSVRAGFGTLAEQYAAIADSVGESDPQLRLDEAAESLAADRTMPSTERQPGDTSGSSESLDLTDEEMRQAFEEFERDYHKISQELFGEESAFSGHLPDRHFYAFAVTIPSDVESEGGPVTVAELLDRLPPSEDIESALSTYIAHLVVAADDPLDGPAIIYPQAHRGTRHQSADE